MTSEGSIVLRATRLVGAAAFFLSLAVAGPATAERKAHDSRPTQDSGPTVRVERADSGSRAADTRPPSPPSGGDHGSSSSSGGDQGSVSSGGDTRPPSGSDGRVRVDRRRPGSSSSWHDHHGRHHGSYYGRYGWWGYRDPYYYWPWWWGGGPYYYYPPYYYEPGYRYGSGYGYGYDRDSGALDLDVSPERAEVYVDGQRVGRADDFDGFPTYLWLPKGTYDVVIYLPGFETISRQYSVYAGVVIDVEDTMQRGESRRPEELVSKSTVNREERLRRNREREEAVERRDDGRDDEDRSDDGDRRYEAPREAYDTRGEPGRLSLTLEPSDASVYLDGRFLGTADDLARLHSGLILDAGKHRLEVVRPGYESKTVEFEVEPGEEARVSVELEESGD